MNPNPAPGSTVPERRPVLVVGAGPAGLTLAVLLARSGVDVRIIDRAAAPSTRSKALLIWPRTLQVLDEIGCGPDVARASLPVESFRYYSSGRQVARMGFLPATRPVVLPQPAVEQMLTRALERAGGTLERGVQLVGLTQADDHVSATVTEGQATYDTQASYVVGCDGASSTVRDLLGIDFEGSTYPTRFVLADAAVEGAIQHDAVHYYCSAQGVLVLIGLPGNRFRVFTGAPPDLEPDAEVELSELQALVDLRGPGGLRLRDAGWTSTFAVQARCAADVRSGRVFLAGDAAHIHSPAGGQGLNTGVTDAHNLAWKLCQVLTGAAPPRLLDTYATERRQVADAVLQQASLQTRAWLLARPAQVRARDGALRVASRLHLFDHRYLPWLAGIRTRYRDGAVMGRSRRRHWRVGALTPPVAGWTPGHAGSGYTLLVVRGKGRGPGTISSAGSAVLDAVQTGNVSPALVEDGAYAALDGARLTPLRRGDVMVLVRPDGHIACVVPASRPAALQRYLSRFVCPRVTPSSA